MNPITTTVTPTPPSTTTTSPRIPQSKLKKYREEQLKLNPICAICQHPITPENAVADHDHRTGRHRAVICRGCNSLLGVIERGYKRFGISPEKLAVIAPTVFDYIFRDWSHQPIHHTHREKTPRKARKP